MPLDLHNINWEELKQLAKEMRRPFDAVYALSSSNDPFLTDLPRRRRDAEWCAKVWDDLDIPPGAHIRRVHYRLISQERKLKLPGGQPFINTELCWDRLCMGSRDARYLQLISADDMVDRRNPEARIYRDEDEAELPAQRLLIDGHINIETPTLTLPHLVLQQPVIPQRYHLELVCEKSTMDDIIDPLGEDYRSNVNTGTGEFSYTRVLQLVRRVQASGLPCRIIYVSDFDPAGHTSMPVAFARKIEFILYIERLDLDIQVMPVVLTYEQCRHWRLPRTPIKDSEKRAAAFEARFGEGATELDALEALHPGELERILRRHIERYFDSDLDDQIREIAAEVDRDLARATQQVLQRHRPTVAKLEAERKKLATAIAASKKRMEPLLARIERDLQQVDIDIDSYPWPEPAEGDEDDDPLFDSSRDYLEQNDRYKKHQGKSISFKRFDKTCEVCGEDFVAQRSTARFCSECARERRHPKATGTPPAVSVPTPSRPKIKPKRRKSNA